jgi:uncharacterized membrane protein
LPAYTVFEYTVKAQKHFVNLVKALLWNGSFKAMPYVVLAIGVYGLIDLFVRRKKHFATKVAALFSGFKIIGFVLLLSVLIAALFALILFPAGAV